MCDHYEVCIQGVFSNIVWKVRYKICSWIPSNKSCEQNIMEAVPNVCAEEPVFGSGFCSRHKEVVESMEYPSDLREFIRSCGANPSGYTKQDKKRVKAVLENLSERYAGEKSLTETAADAQGTVYLLRNRELATESNFEMTEEVDDHCKKNIGQLQTLNKWSRGILAVVGAGGIIEWWCPLYDSGAFTLNVASDQN